MPGLYEYRRPGDNRVEGTGCSISTNHTSSAPYGNKIEMTYGEPFTFSFFTYHEEVVFEPGRAYQDASPYCRGYLYRIGD